ncbi:MULTISPECIES: TRAP transporter large permease [Thalassospira]|jgi:tripartite ATP-independent transporter DctM subunit|uniref:TRAP transporter large permease protein n=3 Tax=Thalassospira TaxID=168934 RepID=A0A853KY21_9PROT|nr:MULTISPECIES: TRAP transporter large permease subunit [Thalassospira]OAZ13206.1 C4-dicarboxylate ABC transporter [Thalassospira profundimaris]AXO15047.1 C4-dicarboxylate ABC transporter [Thalassospira indica]EKF07566.1 C4 dicarboxylate transporter permease [Thalassospira profundimaris WP0211]MBP3126617.1 TRAP transporter large permease subunit [Thalassospira sp. ER-Se-21-Dark]NJB75482.1 tripartite ATP-independent transporter DctM subunit [Thalassospira tepidiphila]|tara:strand:- start:3575 stop:4948 length:1374 start_codon:yes stop_codon:yes gene_type:complete
MTGEILSLVMFAVACGVLLLGFPVAFSLAGTGLAFALIGNAMGTFDMPLLGSLPSRYFGVMTNELYVAIPLFVFMGVMLERARIAEKLLTTMGMLFGTMRGGLGISVVIVGMLLAASTGIVGATVVTMGLLSLPAMQKAGYDPKLSTGVICASGTLGQIIPPSIVLVLLGDILQGAYAEAQRALGNWAPEPISVMDLFAGAFIPGIMLVGLYIGWIIIKSLIDPESAPALVEGKRPAGLWGEVLRALLPPALLIVAVLGSILTGIATPTESAAFGSVGATILAAFYRRLDMPVLRHVVRQTVQVSAMVFVILLGASVFSLVFRGLGGDHLVEELLHNLPGGVFSAMLVVMLLMFVMGFFLDFIEIVFVVIPIVGPILLKLDVDPVWLGVMIAINLQTSFLTPPFGFALFYLRGVAPAAIKTWDIYRGIVPFVVIQMLGLCLVAAFPWLATWLPSVLF